MLEHFLLKKLHNRNVVTLLNPYTAPCKIFNFWKQCCRSTSDSLFMISVTFAFTTSMDSNLVHFNTDLIFGNKKKSHGARSGEYGGCSNTVILCFIKKSWKTGRCVPVWCLGEEPMSRSSIFQVFFFSPIHEGFQNLLVVDLVNGLTFRHPIHVNNPLDVEKKNHHCFKYGFVLPCFLLPCWTGALPVHGLTLTFWVVLKKTWLITSYYVL